jgi:hypothetical protein
MNAKMAVAGALLMLALLDGHAASPPETQDRFVSPASSMIEQFSGYFASDKSHLSNPPAEVIQNGVFRHVPYLSYRASLFELNIYGDPKRPAGVEIGVYKGKRRSKEEIRKLMALLLTQAADRDLVHAPKLDQHELERDGLTFEVTPPTAKDSFGGWWISIYDAKAIERARATDAELAAITREEPPDPLMEKINRPKRLVGRAQGTRRVYVLDYAKENGAYVRTSR